APPPGGARKGGPGPPPPPRPPTPEAGPNPPGAPAPRMGRRRKGRPLSLLPLFGRIVGVEEVRAELTVCDRREIAPAPPIARGKLHRLAREGAPGDVKRAARAAAQNH